MHCRHAAQRVAGRTPPWAGQVGWISLHEGAVRLVMDDRSGTVTHLAAPATALILPEVPHHVVFDGDFLLEIVSLAREAV